MSCRVLKRTMENFVLNSIVNAAKSKGFSKLIGEFIPTAKNKMVKDHYKELGFTETEGRWILDVDNYIDKQTFIKEK